MNQTKPQQRPFSVAEKASIRNAVGKILSHESFVTSPSLSAVLAYIVNQTLAGNGHAIDAYGIAVDALDKPNDFDAQADPAVRVLAIRLQQALDDYQASHPYNDIRVQLAPGAYIPQFHGLDEGPPTGRSVSSPSSIHDVNNR